MSPVRRVRGVPPGPSTERVAILLALVSTAVFVVWFGIRLHEIVVAQYRNSDLASSLLLGEFFGDKGSGYLVLGNYAWLEGLLPLHWTRWVPDHVAFWKAAPYAIYVAAVLLAGWTVRRISSPLAGLVVVLAMAAPAPIVIYMLGVSDQRLPIFAHTIVLAAFLVVLPRVAEWRLPGRLLWAVALAVTLAPAVATDQLIYPAAVLPFLVAVAVGWRLTAIRLEAAGVAVASCLGGVVLGRLLWALAEDQNIVYNHGTFEMAGSGRALSNAGLLLEDTALFAQGQFAAGSVPIDLFNITREIVAIAAIAAVLLFGYVVVRAARPILVGADRRPEQRLLFVYWAVSIVGVALVFVITTAPEGINAVRYLTTVWPALVALVVIVYGRRGITGLALLAAGCAILGSIGLARGLYTPRIDEPPNGRESDLVARFAADNNLDHGYAGYWDAAPISVQSGFDVRVYPIEPCGPNVDTYCPFHSHQIEAWYEPKTGVRSFFVINRQGLEPATLPPPAKWGRPFKTAQLGDLTVYAYDYDISSQFQAVVPGARPPPPPGEERPGLGFARAGVGG
jgi:hypothetical protein